MFFLTDFGLSSREEARGTSHVLIWIPQRDSDHAASEQSYPATRFVHTWASRASSCWAAPATSLPTRKCHHAIEESDHDPTPKADPSAYTHRLTSRHIHYIILISSGALISDFG